MSEQKETKSSFFKELQEPLKAGIKCAVYLAPVLGVFAVYSFVSKQKS